MQTLAIHRHDTTPTTRRVERPAVSLEGFATLVERMLGMEPACLHERIQKGAQLVLTGHIRETDEVGTFLIQGCEGTFHKASSFSCSCPDRQNRGVTCKHSFAVQLFSAAAGEASYEKHQAEWRARQDARRAAQETVPCA